MSLLRSSHLVRDSGCSPAHRGGGRSCLISTYVGEQTSVMHFLRRPTKRSSRQYNKYCRAVSTRLNRRLCEMRWDGAIYDGIYHSSNGAGIYSTSLYFSFPQATWLQARDTLFQIYKHLWKKQSKSKLAEPTLTAEYLLVDDLFEALLKPDLLGITAFRKFVLHLKKRKINACTQFQHRAAIRRKHGRSCALSTKITYHTQKKKKCLVSVWTV